MKSSLSTRSLLRASLFITASVCMTVGGLLLMNRWIPLNFIQAPTNTISELTTEDTPMLEAEKKYTELSITELALKIPLTQGEISDGSWSISNSSASYLTLPTDSQPITLLYGHNWPRLLGPLKKVRHNMSVSLQHEGGTEEYRVKQIEVVKPTDIEDLLSPGNTIIYTCTGAFDSQRLVIFLEKVSTQATTL